MQKASFMLVVLLAMTRISTGRTAFVLTDDNFEHDTQMLTGSTTGDWLVLFCEKKQKKKVCNQMYEAWDALSGELYGRVSAATVDT